jgi:hypothetical protein
MDCRSRPSVGCCRAISADGLLRVQGRQVHLLDLSRLQSIAEHYPEL